MSNPRIPKPCTPNDVKANVNRCQHKTPLPGEEGQGDHQHCPPNPKPQTLNPGHSLGGALSTLCAADFAAVFPKRRIVMYNYGSPRVGNAAFGELVNREVEEACRGVSLGLRV